MIKLSIIIPSFNEAEKLPLLLADLSFFTDNLEIIVSDSGSKDQTELITKIAGVKFIKNATANRGIQLHQGALKANGDWLLFLHADSIIPKSSLISIQDIIKSKANKSFAWFFNLRISKKGIMFRLLELAVYIRSNILREPYGDQGLLISRESYNISGGNKDLYLMEDIDLITRISKKTE